LKRSHFVLHGRMCAKVGVLHYLNINKGSK
jgi:hypothetical protein